MVCNATPAESRAKRWVGADRSIRRKNPYILKFFFVLREGENVVCLVSSAHSFGLIKYRSCGFDFFLGINIRGFLYRPLSRSERFLVLSCT